MFRYILLIILIFFTGCSNKIRTLDGHIIEKNNIKEESFTTREYPGISKDAILEAAKKIFIYAGKKDFRLDSFRNKLLASRTKVNYYGFLVVSHEDFWILSIDNENDTPLAKLELSRVHDYKFDKPEYISKSAHELFWSRLDYLLGLSDEWTSCNRYLDFTMSLCDGLDMPDYKNLDENDLIMNPLIADRQDNKDEQTVSEDILEKDIELTIDDTKEDILDVNENEDLDSRTTEEKAIDDEFTKEIEKLDKKVNDNIDNNLDKIEENIEDEPIKDSQE